MASLAKLSLAPQWQSADLGMLEILLVDDEPATRLVVASALVDAGHRVVEAEDGAEAMALAERTVFDVALCDVRLPKVDGLTLFRHLRRESPGTAVILMTAYATIEDAVTVLREGAYDYVTKPFDCEELTLRVIGRIAERQALRRDLEVARAQLVARDVGGSIVGTSKVMVRLLGHLDTVAQSDAHVLVRGEPGTGKQLVAHTLHGRSARRSAPYVVVSCGALDAEGLEVDLFGTTSSGVTSRGGKLRAAEGGSVHLSEVSALPLPTQAKLARVLDDMAIEGEDGARTSINVRFLSSTEKDLRALVSEGKFREDLLYRVSVLDVALPPLRERTGDLAQLLQYFLKRHTPLGKVPPGIAPRAWAAMADYAFPGNVRELEYVVERALALAHGSEIDLAHLPPEIASRTGSERDAEQVRPLSIAMKEYERQYLVRALHVADGSRARAAELLGLSSATLDDKLRHHGVTAAGA